MSTVQAPNPLPPDESNGGILLTLTYILTAFTIFTTFLRVWARCGRHALGWVRLRFVMVMIRLTDFDRMTMPSLSVAFLQLFGLRSRLFPFSMETGDIAGTSSKQTTSMSIS